MNPLRILYESCQLLVGVSRVSDGSAFHRYIPADETCSGTDLRLHSLFSPYISLCYFCYDHRAPHVVSSVEGAGS